MNHPCKRSSPFHINENLEEKKKRKPLEIIQAATIVTPSSWVEIVSTWISATFRNRYIHLLGCFACSKNDNKFSGKKNKHCRLYTKNPHIYIYIYI